MSHSDCTRPPDWRLRGYLFGVAWCAVFLAALCVLRNAASPRGPAPVSVYLRAGPESAPLPESLIEAFEESVLDEESLQAAESKPTPNSDSPAALLGEHLDASVQREEASDSPALVIRYTGGDAAGASWVRALAEQFVEEHVTLPTSTAESRLESATEELELFRRQLREAEQQVVDLESQQEDVRRQIQQLAQDLRTELANDQPPPPSAPTTPPPPSPSPSPEQVKLQEKLAALRRSRDMALETYTPLHPHVLSLDDAIQNVSARLAALAEVQSPTPDRPSEDERGEEVGPRDMQAENERARWAANKKRLESQLALLADEVREANARYDQLQSELDSAEAQRAEAEREWNRLAAIRLNVSEPEASLLPAGSRQLSHTSFLFALSLGAFCGIGLVTTGVPADPYLRTAAQTSQALALPVVGVVPAGDDSPPPHPYRLPKVTRIARRMCEFVLAVFLLSAVFLAASQDGFVRRLADDPLLELVDSLRSVLQIVGV